MSYGLSSVCAAAARVGRRVAGHLVVELLSRVHTGEAVGGNIVWVRRAKYAGVGSAENVAARSEGWTVGGQMFLSGVFFFQAEDGIRDLTVTGVQTCALPI